MIAPRVRRLAPHVTAIAVSLEEQHHFYWTPVQLESALTAAADDPQTKVIILEGGSTYFSAGGSRDLLVGPDARDAVPQLVADIPRILLEVPLPVIAAAAGHALGGGFAMALCADLLLLGEESLYGANFVSLGFTPGMGSTVLLADVVGEPLARELLFTGRLMKGRELARAGGPSAHAVRPRETVPRRALEIAQEIAAVPRETLIALKRLVAHRRRALVREAVEREHRAQVELLAQESIRAHIAAAYGAPAGLEE
jgi:enoyl-CoA hydratase/carnithine racemase